MANVTCVNDFELLLNNTQAGISTVLCNDAPINVTQTMVLLAASDVRVSCCDQCGYGCKIQLTTGGILIFSQLNIAGSGSLTLDGVELNGNGFTGAVRVCMDESVFPRILLELTSCLCIIW